MLTICYTFNVIYGNVFYKSQFILLYACHMVCRLSDELMY